MLIHLQWCKPCTTYEIDVIQYTQTVYHPGVRCNRGHVAKTYEIPVAVSMQTCHTPLKLINTLRPRQNGRYFADDTFKCIFLNENAWISLKVSLKFVPKVRINNIPALVQIMAWRWQATGHYLNQCWLVYWRIYASLGLNDLIYYARSADNGQWQM